MNETKLPFDLNDEIDWDSLDDHELALVANRLVAWTNVAAFKLSERKFWVTFEIKDRHTLPRPHDPPLFAIHIWKEVTHDRK